MSLFIDKDIVVIKPGKAHILFCGKQSKQFYSADEDAVMTLCKCNERKLVIGHFFPTHYQSLIPRDNLESSRKSSSTTNLKKFEQIEKHICYCIFELRRLRSSYVMTPLSCGG